MKVIMPVWSNDSETINITEEAVNSLKGHELIIVDNGSTVGGGQLREWADLYIRNKTNLGYGKAVNQALKLSGFPVAIANNDIRISTNWGEVTKEILESDPLAGSIHYRMTPYDMPFVYGTHTWETGRERWCTGSFFVLAKEAYFDENFLNSYDDWDLGYRCIKAGYHRIYTTKACYQHYDSFSQVKIGNEEREKRNEANKQYFIKKHGDTAENLFQMMFPDQFELDWRTTFNEL